MDQQVCTNLLRCEVINATRSVGDISHDDHLWGERHMEEEEDSERSEGREGHLTFVLAKRSKISEMTRAYMRRPSGNCKATNLACSYDKEDD